MFELAPGWTMDVERGPDWLIVRLRAPSGPFESLPSLGDALRALLQQHLAKRLIVECDELPDLPRDMVRQLETLHEELTRSGGVMRLSGLNDRHRETLRVCHVERRFPHFLSRREAIHGRPTVKPR